MRKKAGAIFDIRFGFDIGTFQLPLDEDIINMDVDNSISKPLSASIYVSVVFFFFKLNQMVDFIVAIKNRLWCLTATESAFPQCNQMHSLFVFTHSRSKGIRKPFSIRFDIGVYEFDSIEYVLLQTLNWNILNRCVYGGINGVLLQIA